MNFTFNNSPMGFEFPAVRPILSDGAFGTVGVSTGSSEIEGYYVTNPASENHTLDGSGWTFSPFSGITTSTSSYASGVTGGSGNSQVGVLLAGRMSTPFTVSSDGNYHVKFNAALSPILSAANPVDPQSVVCGIFSGSAPSTPSGYANLGEYPISSATYSTITSASIALLSGVSYNLVLSSGARRQLSADYVLIDNVVLEQV